jgi:uncharacterized membrane protein YecN with MAPEG domain
MPSTDVLQRVLAGLRFRETRVAADFLVIADAHVLEDSDLSRVSVVEQQRHSARAYERSTDSREWSSIFVELFVAHPVIALDRMFARERQAYAWLCVRVGCALLVGRLNDFDVHRHREIEFRLLHATWVVLS